MPHLPEPVHRQLNIAMDLTGVVDEAAHSDWTSFNEHLRGLAGVDRVVFGFRSREGLLHFIEDVVTPYMTEVHMGKNLTYAVRDDWRGYGKHNEKWAYASPNSREVQGVH